mgnify:FL=1
MTYVTTAERVGMKKGMGKGMEKGVEKGVEKGIRRGIKEAIADLLDVRFENEGDLVKEKIENVKNIEKLRMIKEAVKTAKSMEEVYKLL